MMVAILGFPAQEALNVIDGPLADELASTDSMYVVEARRSSLP